MRLRHLVGAATLLALSTVIGVTTAVPAGTPRLAAMVRNESTRSSGTVTIARAADSENSPTNGSPRSDTDAPTPPRRHDSTSACESPPSDMSCALVR